MAERVYNKSRYEESAPEMRAALARASDQQDMERIVKDFEDDSTWVEEGEVGLPRSTYAR